MDPHIAVQSHLNYCQDVVRIGGRNVLLGKEIASTKQSCVVISELNKSVPAKDDICCLQRDNMTLSN